MEWVLVLNMFVMNVQTEAELHSQVIELKGFSSFSDCEKAGDAASQVFMMRTGVQNGLEIDCKKAG